MLERVTPPGVCDFSWRGDVCRRVNCSFSHLPAAGTATSVAAQQQQLQALPSPPLRDQPPQYQAAAIVGGGAAGGGAGVSRPPSVARFSKNYAPAAGAGLPSGAERAGGSGSN